MEYRSRPCGPERQQVSSAPAVVCTDNGGGNGFVKCVKASVSKFNQNDNWLSAIVINGVHTAFPLVRPRLCCALVSRCHCLNCLCCQRQGFEAKQSPEEADHRVPFPCPQSPVLAQDA